MNYNKGSHYHGRKVLVVDDSVESVQLMMRLLDHYHCAVTMAFDGQDAIPLLVNENFDLVILDWQMPQMGGRETLVMMDKLISEHKVRKDRKIPVVIFSGQSEEELQVPDCQSFTSCGFISKVQPYSEMIRHFADIFQKVDTANVRLPREGKKKTPLAKGLF